jgi:signal transduction histidine kinase/CheY-like chemotaxis protein/HAMP domain-containing protein
VYRTLQSETEDDFLSIYNRGIEKFWNEQTLQLKNIDFILELGNEKDGIIPKHLTKNYIILPEKEFNLREFKSYNPYLMTMNFSAPDGKKYVYGRAISNDMLNDISQRINSDIALIWDGYPADFSNQMDNQKYLYVLSQAVENLKNKNNFELYIQGTGSKDILATIYKPTTVVGQDNLYFLIFGTFAEAGELRSTLKNIFIIIGLVGIALSLIFTMVFTHKFRKQVTDLSKATEQTYSGKFDYKIEVKSKDEIGKLGVAFNKMLEELKKKEIARNEYAEFITLINQNPSLKEISDVALKKILDTGDFLIGGLYSVDDKITLISSYGLNTEHAVRAGISDFFKKVLETKKSLELYNEEDLPVVSTGLLDMRIKYMLFLPIVYNNRSVAVLELGSLTRPREEVRDYLEKIKDQLAIGITNARALLQLEKLVIELKQLNEEYQKQNVQIKEQNETLLQLHTELKVQAEELERQRQKAIELTDAKSKFLANMSHELRTPMNSILGLTELMLEKVDLEPRSKERLEVVLNSGKRLMTLINDILDLSKIEAGKVEILHEDVTLEEIIAEVSAAISMLANEKSISYEVERKIDTRTIINTDRGKVVQVLINLLGNAVKYTDAGKTLLRVSVVNEMLSFEVVDTGIGISEEEINLIFEEFKQSDSSKSRRRGGTGLGLAISRKLAEILNGKLTAKSKLNQGSTFTFSIPFNQVEVFSRDPNQIPVEILPGIKHGNKTIIIIDHRNELKTTVSKYLSSLGYELIYLEDSNLDFQTIADNQPIAIVLNANLKEVQSWDIIKKIKQNVITQNIPVLLVSIKKAENRAYVLDVFDYLLKPVSSEYLSETLLKLGNCIKKDIQKIAIVDDDEKELEKYNQFLNSDVIKVELINNSEDALSKIEDTKPDLVIMDLTMSGIDGVTLTYMLKSNSETKSIPIIFSFESEIKTGDKKSLTDILEAITLNSNLHITDAFKFMQSWLENQESAKYSQYSSVKSRYKSEINASDLPESHPINDGISELDIMIVDDDPNTLFTLAEIVQEANCNPIIAHNGKECLELLETKIPDLILLDIIMPEMDGFKTIKQIKKNNKWLDIPVIAVTAKAMKEDNEIILKHGFTDYIPKPVNPAFVAYKIQMLITQLKTT